jgi:pilus assembly protein FimV
MVRKLTLAVLFTLGSLPLSVYGVGLGNIKTHSALNQNFKGEIQLLSVPRGELDTMRVKLASQEAFAKVGSEYLHVLSKLKFKPVRRRDGSAVILVTSNDVIREPFLDFLVEVHWPNGRLIREYTVLLDPPVTTKRRPAEISKPRISSKRQAAPAPVAPRRPAVTEDDAPPVTRDVYGPVVANETAWKIAAKLKPQGISIHQMMMALLHANPNAFVNNNINRLKIGQMLRVPGVGEIRGLNRQEAVASFKQQTDDWKASTPKAADAPVSAEASVDADAAEPQSAKIDDDARLQIATARLEADGEAGASEAGVASQTANEDIRHELMLVRENVEASRLETDDLKAAVRNMESQLEDLKSLLVLKDEQLAQLRARKITTADDSVVVADAPQDALSTEAQVETDETIDQDQAVTEAAAISDSKPAEDAAVVEAEPEAIAAAEKPSETVADSSSKQTSWLEDNLTMIAAAAAGLFGTGVLIALMLGRRKKPPLPENDSAEDEEYVPRIYDDTAGISSQSEEVAQENPSRSEYEDGVEVDPLAAADVYIAYDRYDQAQKILEEGIADGDNSVPIRHKLLEVYFATQNQKDFLVLADRMVTDGQDKSDTEVWEHIRDMGKKLDKFNPLFWAADSKIRNVEESELTEEVSSGTKNQDSPLGEDMESLDELDNLELDLSSFGIDDSSESDETPGSGAVEIDQVDLGADFAETGQGAEAADLSDLDVVTQTEPEESAGDSDEEIQFIESIDDIQIIDEVDTKLELARAYMEMGDHEGAMSILKDVLQEGTDDQISSASQLISKLNI